MRRPTNPSVERSLRRAYRASWLFDGRSRAPLRNASLVVEGRHIIYVGPVKGQPPVGETIDLGDSCLLPGLIDAHVHLGWDSSRGARGLGKLEGRAISALRAVNNANQHLRAGVTTIRDVGSASRIAIDVGHAIEMGIATGPRVLAAGRPILMTGGHLWQIGSEADGADGVRVAARAELKKGAALIKLMASGGVGVPGEFLEQQQLTIEEMAAAVDEAHRAGRKATAHAYAADAITNALAAGVDCIEHGSMLSGINAEDIGKRGVTLVPTLSAYLFTIARARELGLEDAIRRKTRRVIAASRESFRIALDAGVHLVTGTDCGPPGIPHGSVATELATMVQYGASPIQALVCATSEAARLLGVERLVGELKPGMLADVLAVPENPTANIRALSNPKLVLRNGLTVPDAGDDWEK